MEIIDVRYDFYCLYCSCPSAVKITVLEYSSASRFSDLPDSSSGKRARLIPFLSSGISYD